MKWRIIFLNLSSQKQLSDAWYASYLGPTLSLILYKWRMSKDIQFENFELLLVTFVMSDSVVLMIIFYHLVWHKRSIIILYEKLNKIKIYANVSGIDF